MKIILLLPCIVWMTSLTQAQNIVRLEYFIDSDAGVGKNQLVSATASPGENFPLTVNVLGILPGYHYLYTRILDDNGKWSLTSKKSIEVLPIQTQNNIMGGEYFFDVDPGVGSANAIGVNPQDSLVMQNFTALVANLQPGPHKLYLRFKDSYGKWSQAVRTNTAVLPGQSGNNISTGEYYFDNDPGFGSGFNIIVSPQDSVIMQNFNLASSGLAVGPHLLYGRFKDTYGKWSQTLRRAVELINNPDTGKIASIEYFYKNDVGFSRASPVQLPVALADGAFTFNIPSNKIPAGLDTLFIRARDSSNNNWSLTTWLAGPNIILPLNLLNFTADRFNSLVQLQWLTENEFNTAFFKVQRSLDGASYTNIGEVNAKGNSVAKTIYNYVDDITNINANKLFYRLQQADKDGKTAYSKVVTLNINQTGFSVFPNPARDYINIIPGSKASPGNSTLIITDVAGHTIIKQKITYAGINKIKVSSLAKGLYTISIVTLENVQTEKLIIK